MIKFNFYINSLLALGFVLTSSQTPIFAATSDLLEIYHQCELSGKFAISRDDLVNSTYLLLTEYDNYWQKGNLLKAESTLNKALVLSKENPLSADDLLKIADGYYQLGKVDRAREILVDYAKPDVSIYYLQEIVKKLISYNQLPAAKQVLDLTLKITEPPLQVDNLLALAKFYTYMKENTSAILLLNKAEQETKKQQSSAYSQGNSLLEIGQLYIQNNAKNKGNSLLEKSLELTRKKYSEFTDRFYSIELLIKLANYHTNIGDRQQGIKLLQEAQSLIDKLNFKEATTYSNVNIYILQNQLARGYLQQGKFDRAKTITNKIKSPIHQIVSRLDIAEDGIINNNIPLANQSINQILPNLNKITSGNHDLQPEIILQRIAVALIKIDRYDDVIKITQAQSYLGYTEAIQELLKIANNRSPEKALLLYKNLLNSTNNLSEEYAKIYRLNYLLNVNLATLNPDQISNIITKFAQNQPKFSTPDYTAGFWLLIAEKYLQLNKLDLAEKAFDTAWNITDKMTDKWSKYYDEEPSSSLYMAVRDYSKGYLAERILIGYQQLNKAEKVQNILNKINEPEVLIRAVVNLSRKELLNDRLNNAQNLLINGQKLIKSTEEKALTNRLNCYQNPSSKP